MPSPAHSNPKHESLERLRRGEIGLDDYLDEQVELAMDPFRARLAEDRLSSLRAVLRETIRTDPVLVELVRRVTGEVPSTESLDKVLES